jgi:mRNA-degrading endonuclease RelE of RelBE toxin-antitoxin system
LLIDDCVSKELKKFPKKDSLSVLAGIEKLLVDLYGGDIQKIKGEKNTWRKRVGNYRIFYEIYPKNNIIHVFWTERRNSKTY